MSIPTLPCYLANRPFAPNHDLAVHDKYSGDCVAHVALADATAVERAIAAAHAAVVRWRRCRRMRGATCWSIACGASRIVRRNSRWS